MKGLKVKSRSHKSAPKFNMFEILINSSLIDILGFDHTSLHWLYFLDKRHRVCSILPSSTLHFLRSLHSLRTLRNNWESGSRRWRCSTSSSTQSCNRRCPPWPSPHAGIFAGAHTNRASSKRSCQCSRWCRRRKLQCPQSLPRSVREFVTGPKWEFVGEDTIGVWVGLRFKRFKSTRPDYIIKELMLLSRGKWA